MSGGDNPPPEPAGRILPPQNPPHLTDCRRPFPPPRAAADGRRMLRAGPARLRRRDRATCPAFFAPHCQRECAAAAVRNRRGMSHRARRRRWPPTAPPPSGGGEKCTGEWTARGWGRRTAQSGALNGRECGGRCWRRRGALGAGGGRMADGISGQNRNSVHLFLARISPPNSARMPPEFGGGGGGGRKMPPPRNLGLCYKPERTRGKIFAPIFLRPAGRMNSGGGGRGEVWQGGGVEQARSILKKTPVQNFQKKYFGNCRRTPAPPPRPAPGPRQRRCKGGGVIPPALNAADLSAGLSARRAADANFFQEVGVACAFAFFPFLFIPPSALYPSSGATGVSGGELARPRCPDFVGVWVRNGHWRPAGFVSDDIPFFEFCVHCFCSFVGLFLMA